MLDVHLLMCWTFEAGVFASNLGPNAFYRLEDGRSPRLNLLRSSSTKNLTGRGKEEGEKIRGREVGKAKRWRLTLYKS